MISTETVLSLSEAARALPKVNGRAPHTSTLWRWIRKGVRGVKLDSLRLGGRFVTSAEALERFGRALAEQELPERPAPPNVVTRSDRQRQRSIASAETVLTKAGIL